MARKKKPAADVPLIHETNPDPETESLYKRLTAAEELIEAQAALICCFELRKSRVRELSRLADAREKYREAING